MIVNNYPIKKEVWLEKYGHDPTKSPRISVTDFQQCSQGTMNTLLEYQHQALLSPFPLPSAIKLNLSVMHKAKAAAAAAPDV